MTDTAWGRRPPPEQRRDAQVLGRWRPATPADVTANRRALIAALGDRAGPSSVAGQDVEALALVFEELVSNAVRHGMPPVWVQVATIPGGWLIDVSDAAVADHPVPAVGRDPARGGLGLHLTAALCDQRGWAVVGDRKHVWASLSCAESAPQGVAIPAQRVTAGRERGVSTGWGGAPAGQPTSP